MKSDWSLSRIRSILLAVVSLLEQERLLTLIAGCCPPSEDRILIGSRAVPESTVLILA